MKYRFVDREKELGFLRAKYSSGSSELIIIYGRRRVGKTELIKESMAGSPLNALYLLGELQKENQLSAIYSTVAGISLGDEFLKNNPFNTWQAFFDYLTKSIEKNGMVLVLDELPYIHKTNPNFISILQYFWDEKWKKMNLKLILCGSSISMMQKITLSYASPIYGRRTGQIDLQPLNYLDFRGLFDDWDEESILGAYAALGGIPRYAEEFDRSKTLHENVMKAFLDKDAFLYKEAKFLLMEELKDFANYFSILKAVALGKSTFNEISNFSGVSTSKLFVYLSKLIELNVIRRDIPVTLSKEKSTRVGNYTLKDYFFRFWFRYIYPNSSLIEIGRPDIVLEMINRDFNEYLDSIFEDVSIELLQSLSLNGELPLLTKWGKWWRMDDEIDIVATNEATGDILFCECEWQEKESDIRIMEELLEKSERVEWGDEKRKNHYAVVIRRGFTEEAKRFAEEKKIRLFSLNDLTLASTKSKEKRFTVMPT
ncbi:MAG: ATP-binding protein [Candidatus Methanoperedens sp.]|nr:ATP-binding protein [Candidatus Methanoperedens sp.]MCZ7370734.1 ATP-binding protein [Candidatus Methanoperedens sp.]